MIFPRISKIKAFHKTPWWIISARILNYPALFSIYFYMLVPIDITPKAIEEIKNIMVHKKIPADYQLRVGVKGGGCGGMAYALGFDKPKAGDQYFEIAGIPVLLEKRHVMFLMGMTIDFYEGSDARGFTFINPEAEANNNASGQQAAGKENV